MTDADKILQAIAGLQEGQKLLQAAIDQQGKTITVTQKDISGLKDSLAHTNTAIKTLATKKDVEALPIRKDVEEIVETAIDAAKSELRADILRLDAKVVRKIPSLERRVTNIEEQEEIENPEKH
jgi:hypothetical protein